MKEDKRRTAIRGQNGEPMTRTPDASLDGAVRIAADAAFAFRRRTTPCGFCHKPGCRLGHSRASKGICPTFSG